MKKLILSAAFLAFAGFSAVQASEVKDLKNTAMIAVQDSAVKTDRKSVV